MNKPLTPTPLLEVKNLSRTFGQGANLIKAVDGFSFQIYPGEIVTVVGESGSGKTTLGRVILRLLNSTGGEIFFKGRNVTRMHGGGDLRAYWQKVQAVFQDPYTAFNQFYSINTVLKKALQICEKKWAGQERIRKIKRSLLEVGLDPGDVLDKWPHQLSGGQVQRVMIARALTVGPELLIADEVTSMLDASLRVTALNLLGDLRREHNMAILFITHDLGQAYYLSDRILVMYHGQLVEQGPVETVLAKPQHEYTKRLMKDVPLLRGRKSMMDQA
ncbi:MAG: dipeptide/oligopeptide/nickel ABC transporter ATP-binding protein [Chloroflexi bacterium RBG_13_60_9]|nr:MAG: dipeptide/oligopeptide/nickel ABC transporter ATP-binding protein [Chloroflexi bacterium RBG_13_60_9]